MNKFKWILLDRNNFGSEKIISEGSFHCETLFQAKLKATRDSNTGRGFWCKKLNMIKPFSKFYWGVTKRLERKGRPVLFLWVDVN